jgi:hypothetical protein
MDPRRSHSCLFFEIFSAVITTLIESIHVVFPELPPCSRLILRLAVFSQTAPAFN